MKYLIASDVHGSLKYAEKLIKVFNESKAEKLILLGDLYYHGPRNPLPEGYNPKEVAVLFNKYKDKLLVVRGNCDAEVDQMISEFSIQDYLQIEINGKVCSFYHGHKDIDLPKKSDVIFNGHTHICKLEKIGNITYANPGSITLPKSDISRDYIILDNNTIVLKDLETSKEIKSLKF